MEELLKDANVLVLGLGASGTASAKVLLQRGAKVWGMDQQLDRLIEEKKLAELIDLGLSPLREAEFETLQFDLIVVSPGIPQSNPVYQAALKAGKLVIGEAELALRLLKNPVWIGITGTNGKTTVTLMVAHILNSSGMPARALGNVGTALCSQVDGDSSEIIVAELSSFQLETLQTPGFQAGLLLNITPDHLDRYASMEAYAAAKCRLQKLLKPEGELFVEKSTALQWPSLLNEGSYSTYGREGNSTVKIAEGVLYFRNKPELDVALFKDIQSHDLENVLAAYAACRCLGVEPQQFAKGYAAFRKPPHRVEFVAEVDGVMYYDDSKGTNLDAVLKAVASMKGPVILIAGGVHKGASYHPWLDLFRKKVKLICAIGEAAPLLQKDLGFEIPLKIFHSLGQAVDYATEAAAAGDHVLLSPGCASFDMFKDYAHRGEEFQRLVRCKSNKIHNL